MHCTQLTTDDRQPTTAPIPFGEERTELGTWLDASEGGYTDLGYTGQRNYAILA